MVLHLAAIITSCVSITSCGVTNEHATSEEDVTHGSHRRIDGQQPTHWSRSHSRNIGHYITVHWIPCTKQLSINRLSMLYIIQCFTSNVASSEPRSSWSACIRKKEGDWPSIKRMHAFLERLEAIETIITKLGTIHCLQYHCVVRSLSTKQWMYC